MIPSNPTTQPPPLDPTALFRLVLFPTLTLGLLFLGTWLGAKLLLSERKLGELEDAHWSEQNRVFWNAHLYVSFLRLFSNFLMGVVIISLISDSEVNLPLPAMIAMIILGMLSTLPPFGVIQNRIRKRWSRIDFPPLPRASIPFTPLFSPPAGPHRSDGLCAP